MVGWLVGWFVVVGWLVGWLVCMYVYMFVFGLFNVGIPDLDYASLHPELSLSPLCVLRVVSFLARNRAGLRSSRAACSGFVVYR